MEDLGIVTILISTINHHIQPPIDILHPSEPGKLISDPPQNSPRNMHRDGQGPPFQGRVGNGQTLALQDEGDVAGLT